MAVARFTLSTGIEGGIAVYKSPNTGKLSISQAMMPSIDEIENIRELHNIKVGIEDHLSEQDAAKTFFYHRLLTTIYPLGLRRDLALTVHSHPAWSDDDPVFDPLTPSLRDIEVFAHDRGRNPRLIDGILNAIDSVARLKLIRESSSTPFSYFHDHIDRQPDSEAMDDLLRSHGFNVATAIFDLTKGRLVTEPDVIVEQLFQ